MCRRGDLDRPVISHGLVVAGKVVAGHGGTGLVGGAGLLLVEEIEHDLPRSGSASHGWSIAVARGARPARQVGEAARFSLPMNLTSRCAAENIPGTLHVPEVHSGLSSAMPAAAMLLASRRT